jgi:xanthine/CO dehydrogenase XdhC/CoxF family maturation factor
MVREAIEAIRRLVDTETLGADITCVAGPAIGTRAVVEAGVGIVAGSIPSTIRDDVLADAVSLMTNEQSRTRDYGDHRVFISTIAPPPVLVIFGAGHVSQSVARISKGLGYRVIVVDSRTAWATDERFPDVDELVVGWPDAFFENHELDGRTYVALLNHDARFENPVLARVKDAPVRYIGAIGSRRTHAGRIQRLTSEGWSDAEVARIHAPIGLDIKAQTPEEIAVAVVAEMTEVRYSGEARRLTT